MPKVMLAVALFAVAAIRTFGITAPRKSTCNAIAEEPLDNWFGLYIGHVRMGDETRDRQALYATGSSYLVTPVFTKSAAYLSGDFIGEPVNTTIEYAFAPARDVTVGADHATIAGCKILTKVHELVHKNDELNDHLPIVGMGPHANETLHPYFTQTDRKQRVAFCIPDELEAKGLLSWGVEDPSPFIESDRVEVDSGTTSDDASSASSGGCAKIPGCNWIKNQVQSVAQSISRGICGLVGDGDFLGMCTDDTVDPFRARPQLQQVPSLKVHGGEAATHWGIKVKGVELHHENGAVTPVADDLREVQEAKADQYWVAVIDTGASMLAAPDGVITSLHQYLDEYNLVDCSDPEQLASKLPKLSISLDAGDEEQVFTLKPSDYVKSMSSLKSLSSVQIEQVSKLLSFPPKTTEEKRKLKDVEHKCFLNLQHAPYPGVFVLGVPFLRGTTSTFDYVGRKVTITNNQGEPCTAEEKATQKKQAITAEEQARRAKSLMEEPLNFDMLRQTTVTRWSTSPRV